MYSEVKNLLKHFTTCNFICATEFENNISYFCKGNVPLYKIKKLYTTRPILERCAVTVNDSITRTFGTYKHILFTSTYGEQETMNYVITEIRKTKCSHIFNMKDHVKKPIIYWLLDIKSHITYRIS